MTGRRRLTLGAALACGALPWLSACASAALPRASNALPRASAALPPIKHVFVIILENEAAATSFGPSSPAPYLSQTLVSEGAFLGHYYGIGHNSLDNYIAMVSGQAPNPTTSADCLTFADFAAPTSMTAGGQENGQGCVYPVGVPTLMSQLQAKTLTWRGYMDGMGADPARESSTCGHPAVGAADDTQSATATDQYATRHDPFVYFHSVIDNQALCSADVVNLSRLPGDLASAGATPSYVFVTPNLCDDGHDATCANGGPGGLPAANAFLKAWVPQITSSPAYRQGGLLIVTFDESVGDASACCGEQPGPFDQAGGILPGGTGPGGGVVGAVLLSPFIKPGTTTSTPYNHYSMLATVEDLFGLPRLAAAAGTPAFGSDVFTQPDGPPGMILVAPRLAGLKPAPRSWSHKRERTTISYTDTQAAVTTLTVEQLRPGYRRGRGACQALGLGRRRPLHTTACTATRRRGSFRHTDVAGANAVAFAGQVGGRSLGAGAYLLVAVPRLDAQTGSPLSVKFTVT